MMSSWRSSSELCWELYHSRELTMCLKARDRPSAPKTHWTQQTPTSQSDQWKSQRSFCALKIQNPWKKLCNYIIKWLDHTHRLNRLIIYWCSCCSKKARLRSSSEHNRRSFFVHAIKVSGVQNNTGDCWLILWTKPHRDIFSSSFVLWKERKSYIIGISFLSRRCGARERGGTCCSWRSNWFWNQ